MILRTVLFWIRACVWFGYFKPAKEKNPAVNVFLTRTNISRHLNYIVKTLSCKRLMSLMPTCKSLNNGHMQYQTGKVFQP